MASRCEATNASGEPCGSGGNIEVDPDGQHRCVWHSTDPERVERARQMRSKGNSKGGPGRRWRRGRPHHALPEQAPPEPQTLSDCVRWSAWITHSAAIGLIDSGTARVCTNAIAELRRSLETRDLEKEARELRREVARLKKNKAR